MMNEEQLQRIEKGFAVATPLSIYNPHSDRALVDIMVDLESRTIVPALIAEVRALRAKLDAVPGYVFACINARERGEMVLPSLGEWLAWQADPDTSADGLVIPDDGGDE